MRIQIMWIALAVIVAASFSPLFGMQGGGRPPRAAGGGGNDAGRPPRPAGPNVGRPAQAGQQGQGWDPGAQPFRQGQGQQGSGQWQEQQRRQPQWDQGWEQDYDGGGGEEDEPRGIKRPRVEQISDPREPYNVFVKVPLSNLQSLDYGLIIQALQTMLDEDDEFNILTQTEVDKTKARMIALQQPVTQVARPPARTAAGAGRPAARAGAAASAPDVPEKLIEELKTLLADTAKLQTNYQDEKVRREKKLEELEADRKARRAQLETLQNEASQAQTFIRDASAIQIELNKITESFVDVTDKNRERPAKKGWLTW